MIFIPKKKKQRTPFRKELPQQSSSYKDHLNKNPLFWNQWYLDNNPDVRASGMDPAEHYGEFGEAEGRRPNPYFDPAFYAKKSAASRKFEGLKIEHYARRGWKNGVNPSADFSLKLYLEYHPDVAEMGVDPLAYHLETGRRENRLVFPEAAEYNGNEHIAKYMATIHESGLFLKEWYRNYYDDLWFATINPLFHFVMHGADEKRQPNPYFDTGWYEKKYEEEVGDENPLIHYIKHGNGLKFDPSPSFSAALYQQNNPDFDPASDNALSHFLKIGKRAGTHVPNPNLLTRSKKATYTKDADLPVSSGLRSMIDLPRNALRPKRETFDPNCLDIHFIIPDFTAGGGGHMTIFRIIHLLERRGHKLTLWINDPTIHKTPQDAFETIAKHYQHIDADVFFVSHDGQGLTGTDAPKNAEAANVADGPSFAHASGDILVATDCWTVWPALVPSDFKRRFYFVQDFEPAFHPMGANYLAAELTYQEDFDCICASPWLSSLLSDKYGRWARHFWLAADTDTYAPPKERPLNTVPRIAVYARHVTARRAVDLAFAALDKLAKRGVAFEVEFFGAQLPFDAAPFKFTDHGIASPDTLADIFRRSDIGIVFSATNYSLVPQEMMACGLPLLELDGDNTRAIFPDDVALLAKPDPRAIADALERLIGDPELRDRLAAAALTWVNKFSWPASAKMVEAAFIERLESVAKPDTTQKTTLKTASTITPTAPRAKASVVIPTFNAGTALKPVLDRVVDQVTPWPYEILVIDSGSSDGTVELVQSYDAIKLHQIDSSDFNHGGTRNLGVELTEGEFIAFLTHDAQPANRYWLTSLVSLLERYPDAAGAFGKHLPYPDASPYTKRDLKAHFDMMADHPLLLDKNTDRKRFKNNDQGWRQLLHFYSDNNSCMRRSVWEDIPYRTVAFGEDQLWANDIIEAGHAKLYAPQAVVYHSHDFDEDETRKRNATESAFFKHFFGYELIKNEEELQETLKALNDRDEEWGRDRGLSDDQIAVQKRLNRARLMGYLDGLRADTSAMF